MANQTVAPRPITFEGISGLYHFFRNEARDDVSARHLTDFIQGLKLSVSPPDKSMVPVYFKDATSALAKLMNDVKRHEERIKLPYSGLDHRITLLKLGRKEFAEQVSTLKKDTMGALIKKVVEVVKGHFNGKDVEQVFQEEANRQQNVIEDSQLCMGLAGIYEICVKRPNLGYDLIKGHANLRFLQPMKNHLMKVIASFSGKENSGQQGEGIYHFGRLLHEMAENREAFQRLCVEGSDAELFFQLALKASPEEHPTFYRKCRAAVLSQFAGGFAESHKILDFINQQAEEISARVPETHKGSMTAVAKKIASGFAKQEDHGQGALIFGQENPMVRYMSQWFGSGVNEGPTMRTTIDPTNPLSLDGSQASEKLKKKLRESVADGVEGYYQRYELVSTRYTVHSANINTTQTIKDPIDRAIGTVRLVVGYEIQKHIEENGILFGLDPSQRVALGREKAKKVILFGIQKKIFGLLQLIAVCRDYGFTPEDQDAIGEALRAAYANEELLRQELDSFTQRRMAGEFATQKTINTD